MAPLMDSSKLILLPYIQYLVDTRKRTYYEANFMIYGRRLLLFTT